jgi:molybdopterin biosynthesis enzyme
VISIDEAVDAVLAAVVPLPGQEVALQDALGRASAEDIVSPEPVPRSEERRVGKEC